MLHSIRKNRCVSTQRLLAAILAFCLSLTLLAAPPGWWQQRRVAVPGAPEDDYALANQGQVKQIATAAFDELEARLSSGAGPEVTALIKSWHVLEPISNQPALASNPRSIFRVVNGRRVAKSTSQSDDYAPANLGQLKAVARPFYDRLIELNLRTGYPWANSPTPADDFAAANLGQLKNLFSFVVAVEDSDGDGLADAWEIRHFGRLDLAGAGPGEDWNHDGFTNLYDYENGLDPTRRNPSAPVIEEAPGGNQLNLRVFTPLER